MNVPQKLHLLAAGLVFGISGAAAQADHYPSYAVPANTYQPAYYYNGQRIPSSMTHAQVAPSARIRPVTAYQGSSIADRRPSLVPSYRPAPAGIAPGGCYGNPASRPTGVGYGTPVGYQYAPAAYRVPAVSNSAVYRSQSPYYYGQGLFGQPVQFVDGQPVRNAFRWFAP